MAGLTEVLQKGFARFSRFQQKYFVVLLVIIVVLTLLVGSGMLRLDLESDLSKLDPQDLPITKLNREVNEDFSDLSSIVVLVKLDDSVDSSNVPYDIRDPEVIEFLIRLDKNLREEISIQNVVSLGSVFEQGVPGNIEGVKQVLEHVPQINSLINDDYSITLVTVEADIGADSNKIKKVSNKVREIISYSSPPSGVKTVITGDAPLGAVIFDTIIHDAVLTFFIAVVFIFVLLLIILRSLRDAIIVLIPLLFGVFWTFGFLGWLGIPITIGTAGMSAMLIGLGVEYAIFMVARYREERLKNEPKLALENAVSNIGASVFSSGGTTVIGFLALSTSLFPVLSDIGKTLAIGILMLVIATIALAPLLLIVQEKFSRKKVEVKKKRSKVEGVFRGYGRFVSKKPGLVLIIALLITVGLFFASQNLNNQDMEFENILPNDLEAMQAYLLIQDEFIDTVGTKIYLEIEPSGSDTDEPVDMREFRVLQYIDLLSQKVQNVDYFEGYSSLSKFVKDRNNGVIPESIAANLDLFEGTNLVSKDYRISLLRVSFSENVDGKEVVRQLQEIIDTTEKPAGIRTEVIGGLAVSEEVDAVFGPDSNRTSMIAFLVIIVFLFILSRSFKGVVLPLLTVVLGIVWTLGLIGVFRVPFNNITSSVITMTIGIGIDFGIQLTMRYQHELKKYDRRKAMEETLTNVLNPMVITVIAAVVGFRALAFGDLKVMADLGVTMSIAVTACMLVAISAIAALSVLFLRRKKLINKEEVSTLK